MDIKSVESTTSFCEPGGIEYDEDVFREESIRADLCEIAQHVSYQHGVKIVDLILANFDIKPKKKFGGPPRPLPPEA